MAQRGPSSPRGRRFYIKGIGAVSEGAGGSFVFRTAPQRRKKTPTQAQRYAQGTMQVAARFVSLATAWEYQQAKDIAGRSGYTWKDMLISQFFGTAIEFTDINGVFWQGRRILAKEIQTLLDSISATPGSILVRTATGWAALYIGAAGYSMTVNPGTTMPDWLPAASGGGGSDIYAGPNVGTPTFNSTSSATIGLPYIGKIDIKMKEFLFFFPSIVSGAVYRAFIANINASGTILGVLALSADTFTASGTGPQAATFTFPSAPALPAGSRYAFCLVRTDATATTTAHAPWLTVSTAPPIPGFPFDYARMAVDFGAITRTFFWNSNSIAPSGVAMGTPSVNTLQLYARLSLS